MDTTEKSEGNNKLQKVDLYRCIVAVMTKQFHTRTWKPFPETFKVLQDEKGDIDYVEISNEGVVRFVSHNYLTDCIMRYVEQDCPQIGQTLVKVSDLNEIVKRLHIPQMYIDIKKVKPVLEASQPGLTFRRLPWDLTEGTFPTFEEFLYRTSNAEALMAWIGSLFYEGRDRQQYVWLYGEGRNGKGSLCRILQRVFGHSYATEQPPPRDDRFWTSGLLGKRLVVFPDCNHYAFPTTGLFKSLTGGDRVRIERKGCQPFDAELTAMFMFLSNGRPKISSQEADLRRAIFSEISPVDIDFGSKYEELLWKEAPHFLHRCKQEYDRLCPDGGTIPIDRSITSEIAASAESEFEAVFDKYFITEPIGMKLVRDLPYVTPIRMKRIFDIEKMDRDFKDKFRQWMERVKGVTYKKVRSSEGREAVTEYRWLGLRERSIVEQVSELL